MQEKRHFKLFAQRYSGNNSNYIKLFNAIASQDVYDEKKIKQKLRGHTFIKHLPFEKHRLQQVLTRALRLYHTGRGIDIQVKELLLDAEILHEKSLYTQCRKVLAKARALANKYERFVFIPEIVRLESRLFDLENLEQVYKEEAVALKKMQVINRYRSLSNKMALLVSSTHQIRKRADLSEFERLMKNPLLQHESMADTFTSRVYYFYIQAVFCEMKGDLRGGYLSRKRFVQLIEKDPMQMQVHAKNYLSALNNLAISQLELQLFEDANQTVKKLKDVPSMLKGGKGEDIEVSSFVFSSIIKLNIGIRTGHFAQAYTVLPEIEKGLQKWEAKIQEQFKIVIYNSIKYVCFGAGHLRSALRWSNRIINQSGHGVRHDIQAMARIFNLILHYELGNIELLEYMLKSTYRFLLKSNHLYKVETIMLNYIRKSAYLTSENEIKKSFATLYKELVPLSKNKYEKKAFEGFDLLAWLRSKIENKSFELVVKERAFSQKKLKTLKNSLKANKR